MLAASVPFGFQILNRGIHRNHVVAVGAAFDAFNADRHGALVDDGDRAGGVDRLADVGVEAIQIFAIAFEHGETMAFQGLLDAETTHVAERDGPQW
jgi:hypothetical protein